MSGSRSHIHELSWLSGSTYVNVPGKSDPDSGNLFVPLGREGDALATPMNLSKPTNIVTGSVVLFPLSLIHRDIPFEAEEERIALAFYVKPI